MIHRKDKKISQLEQENKDLIRLLKKQYSDKEMKIENQTLIIESRITSEISQDKMSLDEKQNLNLEAKIVSEIEKQTQSKNKIILYVLDNHLETK